MRAASFVNRGWNNSASLSSPNFHESRWETINVYTTQTPEVEKWHSARNGFFSAAAMSSAANLAALSTRLWTEKNKLFAQEFLIKYAELISTMTKRCAQREGAIFSFWLTSLVYIGFYFPFLMRRSVLAHQNFAVWKLKRSKEIYIIRF